MMNSIDVTKRLLAVVRASLGNKLQLVTEFLPGIPDGLVIRLRDSVGRLLDAAAWPQLGISGNLVTATYTDLKTGTYTREYCWPDPDGDLQVYASGDIFITTNPGPGKLTGESLAIVYGTGGVVEKIDVGGLDVLAAMATIQADVTQKHHEVNATIDTRIYFIGENENGIIIGWGPTAQVEQVETQYGPGIQINY